MRIATAVFLVLVGSGLSACSSQLYKSLPRGEAAYAVIPPINESAPPSEYLIQPGDIIALTVFGEPDLTIQRLPVDDAGFIQVPLIGAVQISGLSPAKATSLVASRLGTRYLRDPQVTLNLVEQSGLVVTVEGQVTKAGSYPIDNQTTLLGAVALAQSPTRIAKLDEIVIFRTLRNQRLAARFDLSRIRAGLDPDPKILGGDVVVVGFSQVKSVYRDVLLAAPLLNIFTRF